MKRRSFLLSLMLVAGWVGLGVVAHGQNPAGAVPDSYFAQDHLIVVFQAGVQDDQKDAIQNAHGDQDVEPLPSINARLVKIRGNRSLAQAIQEYQGEANVFYVQPNYIYHAVETIPNDSYFGLLWAMKNTGQSINGTVGTAGADIEATLAWDKTKGTAGVVVGVVDTGVDYTHPDLAANIWSNPGGIGGGAAGTHGFNAITGTYDPMDDNGHGTHVSGTIGASGNNGAGVVGVNWTTSIMGLKFLDASGSGTTVNAIKAIDFAVQAKLNGVNVRVLNASWGGGGPDPLLLAKIQTANDNGILFVAAAGNGDSRGRPINIDSSPFYPASYSLSALNVIAVAATDNRDLLASWSNYGANTVQLGAPGVNIASTWPGNQYYWASGTSMATPHVVGAAALILSLQPELTVAQLKAAILNNVDPISSLSGKTVTGGRLNVNKAVQAANPTPDFSLSIAPSSMTVALGGSTTYTVTVGSLASFSEDVNLSVSGLPVDATVSYSQNPVLGGSGSSDLTVTTASGTTPASYTLTITGTSASKTHMVSATLVVAVPDFSLSIAPSSRTVAPGGSTTYTVTVGSLASFSEDVNLSVSGLPVDATVSYSQNPVLGGSGSSGLTVTTASGTTPASYTLTITGTSASKTQTVSATLVVATPDFSLSATPSFRTVRRGSSTTYTVTVTPSGGFTGTVGFSVSGLPSNATGTFSPPSVTTSGSSTLRITTKNNTTRGTYPLTITGTSNPLVHTATVSLTVN